MAWPTTDDPRTEFVSSRLTATEAATLDAAATSKSMSRSEYVRQSVARCAAADMKKQRAASGKVADQ